MRQALLIAWVLVGLLGCDPQEPSRTSRPDYVLVIHGGAGSTPAGASQEQRQAAEESLERVLREGLAILDRGGSSLDAVEHVIRLLEDDPLFNAGKGSVFNDEGGHELDASIMDGATLACGGVAGVRTVKNPISLARMVMEQTTHVLFAADGAERFADRMGVERVEQDYFFTQKRWDSLQRARREPAAKGEHGTVGAVALDRDGNLAAGTSTGGLTNKQFGRVGDSPIIGAGTYADNRTCAVSGTGKGEEFIRKAVAYSVSALMAERGMTAREAADEVVHGRLKEGQGGVIVLGADGSIAMVFNTEAMYRGAADSNGRFEVAITRD